MGIPAGGFLGLRFVGVVEVEAWVGRGATSLGAGQRAKRRPLIRPLATFCLEGAKERFCLIWVLQIWRTYGARELAR